MIIASLCFYLFAAVMIASAVMVITARNPVHCVLFLILAFLNGAGLFVLMGAEFLGLILAIVYVGAVAVLFMFVVMMLDTDFSAIRGGFLQYLPIGGAIGLVLMIELGFAVAAIRAGEGTMAMPMPNDGGVSNTEALGRLLYTNYFYLFQAAGVILLIAMVGAIVLTLRRREGVRRQTIVDQVARRREDSIEIRRVTPGSGI
ncbi:MAG: NADH-quinone oxidoreductase subunit J [Alphaproteobacteria bacterium]|jgi:NADH-quinone oxidoreductase subunit J|nr:NADH-quinone oxidoreductase subunit J [Alphaproteobacteria bacterium]MDP6238653.1 NADH-quinone oxidoreductase subunit J [Alphaproteobacteria bacterium]MDP7173175.1 NADH-quinone oxidoreductase subunit J [Alphaproteobacteria bacterium]MDP7233566.1 NADH-quinone oxidoreductase subunit J [Alphaproteobacteria bacterium]MDP7487492.1 NADH-quinone oxidoreductase subunit J [Alphaproteobacteria bacterium]|tara:strand:- start:1667 stop:2272 length:606 start_codon:yes stop_codon:yes gene_type:complete